MRYLTSNELFAESLHLGLATGSMPPTYLRPRIDATTRLVLEPSTVLPSGPMNLLLAERTASWCLLSPLETEVAQAADDSRFADLQARYPQIDEPSLLEFFVRLYQRGLLRVDGKPGLNPTLLDDGALFQDGYLVEVLVTQKCNLACRYCLAEAGPDMPHLHPELAYAAVDAAFNLPTTRPLMIQLSGGEPFVNFGLFKALVEYIEEKRRLTDRPASISTQSNGTLIDDQIAEFVKAHQISIGISCDGPRRFSDLSRPMLGGQPSYERTIRGMQTLWRHGVRFGVILVLNRANVGHPEQILDFFTELGIDSIKINPINMIGDAQLTWDSMSITSVEYFEFLDRLLDCIIDKEISISEYNLLEYIQHFMRRVHNYRCMRSNCGAGRSFFLIDAAGEVYPCAHSAGIPSWRLGKIDDAAGDLLGMGAKHAIIQLFPLRLVEQLDDTRPCPWRHFCEGGCAVNAFQRHGTILAADTLCAFYEIFYPRLLERLASAPARFQKLLDLTLGPQRASVVDFALTGDSMSDSREAGLPAPTLRYRAENYR